MVRVRSLPPMVQPLPPMVPAAPKRADPELGTTAHKAWARDVKERAGWRCEDPDHDTSRPRGGPGVALYADHIVERHDAPHLALDRTNGMCRCAPCHGRKTAAERDRRLGP